MPAHGERNADKNMSPSRKNRRRFFRREPRFGGFRSTEVTGPQKVQEISVSLIAKRNIINSDGLTHDQIAAAILDLTHVRLDRENISTIDNLECLGKVTNLYLQHNIITEIENLESLSHVSFLALAGNKIAKIGDLKCMKSLKFLDLSDNQISGIAQDDLPEGLLILSLEGNPCTSAPHYRSVVLKACPRLTQLDGKHVTKSDRLAAGCELLSDEEDSTNSGSADDDENEIEENVAGISPLSSVDPALRILDAASGGLKQHADDIILRAKIRAMKEDADHEQRLDTLQALRSDVIRSAQTATPRSSSRL